MRYRFAFDNFVALLMKQILQQNGLIQLEGCLSEVCPIYIPLTFLFQGG